MLAVRDVTALKLFVDHTQHVWFADGVRTPVMSNECVAEFAAGFESRPRLPLRILGTAANAELITALYPKCVAAGVPLELAGPVVCESVTELRDPSAALYRMRQCTLPASLGGWHGMTSLDYPAYALCAHFDAGGAYDATARQLLSQHPVWYDLRFVDSISAGSVACLLGEILDPRWFVHPQHPERVARLRAHLGVQPRTVRALHTPGGPATPLVLRLACTVQAWQGCGASPSADIVAQRCLQNPRNFLWSVFAEAGCGLLGVLRATQTFVAYLFHTWLEALQGAVRWRPDPLFDPEKLFKTEEQIRAYVVYSRRRPVRFDNAGLPR